MNKIQKGKSLLIGLGFGAIVLGLLALVGGIVLLVKGIGTISETAGIVKTVFGAILLLFSFGAVPFGIKWTWVGLALNATQGNLKEDNIAMAGTVNMKKCDKCGTELKDGETKCSNCGKQF